MSNNVFPKLGGLGIRSIFMLLTAVGFLFSYIPNHPTAEREVMQALPTLDRVNWNDFNNNQLQSAISMIDKFDGQSTKSKAYTAWGGSTPEYKAVQPVSMLCNQKTGTSSASTSTCAEQTNLPKNIGCTDVTDEKSVTSAAMWCCLMWKPGDILTCVGIDTPLGPASY